MDAFLRIDCAVDEKKVPFPDHSPARVSATMDKRVVTSHVQYRPLATEAVFGVVAANDSILTKPTLAAEILGYAKTTFLTSY